MTVVKAVLFDCFGVLILPNHIGIYDKPNDPLFDYIATSLKPQFTTGIISNILRDNLVDLMGEHRRRLFDVTTLSYDVGASKPDRAIYDEALRRAGLSPQECVFIDDIEGFCVAAERVGMRSIHYQTYEQTIADLEAIIHENIDINVKT